MNLRTEIAFIITIQWTTFLCSSTNLDIPEWTLYKNFRVIFILNIVFSVTRLDSECPFYPQPKNTKQTPRT